jgi:hypothetical protein
MSEGRECVMDCGLHVNHPTRWYQHRSGRAICAPLSKQSAHRRQGQKSSDMSPAATEEHGSIENERSLTIFSSEAIFVFRKPRISPRRDRPEFVLSRAWFPRKMLSLPLKSCPPYPKQCIPSLRTSHYQVTLHVSSHLISRLAHQPRQPLPLHPSLRLSIKPRAPALII